MIQIQILSEKEREERVLELHFNQNKNYRQIAKELKMSVRDIGEIVNRAKQEKERQEHKSLAVQAYDKFFKGKTPLQVAIDLNIGQAQTTQYYSEYLKLAGLEDIINIYIWNSKATFHILYLFVKQQRQQKWVYHR